MEIVVCFIKEKFFEDNSNFVKMLDAGNTVKQSRRSHLCVMVEKDGNNFYIPLRNNLGEDVRKFGRIGHSIPSKKRQNAGLDYRYAIIVNNLDYLEIKEEKKIPEAQYRKIKNDYDDIVKEFTTYVNGYKKAVKKHRNDKEPLYKESSLINFMEELGC